MRGARMCELWGALLRLHYLQYDSALRRFRIELAGTFNGSLSFIARGVCRGAVYFRRPDCATEIEVGA